MPSLRLRIQRRCCGVFRRRNVEVFAKCGSLLLVHRGFLFRWECGCPAPCSFLAFPGMEVQSAMKGVQSNPSGQRERKILREKGACDRMQKVFGRAGTAAFVGTTDRATIKRQEKKKSKAAQPRLRSRPVLVVIGAARIRAQHQHSRRCRPLVVRRRGTGALTCSRVCMCTCKHVSM